MTSLTHLDSSGRARMVDIRHKDTTHREATAEAEVVMSGDTLDSVLDETSPKGDVLAVARIAGISGGKRTPELIPLTHPVGLESLIVEVTPDERLPGLRIEATAATTGKTGVEMEAMTAVSIAALTVYDMLKSVEKSVRISNIRLLRKTGGKSGEWRGNEE